MTPSEVWAAQVATMKAGDHFMQATRGLRGWFAVEMWLNGEDYQGEVFAEPWQSDFMTYESREEAEARAQELAAEHCIPYLA